MRACVHHEISAVAAFDGVPNFRNLLLLDLHSRAQTIRASDFLHSFGGNRKKLICHCKQNHSFRPAALSRFDDILRGNLHCARAGTSLENFTTRRSMAALTSFRSTTSSTAPVLIASAGMPKITEDASS